MSLEVCMGETLMLAFIRWKRVVSPKWTKKALIGVCPMRQNMIWLNWYRNVDARIVYRHMRLYNGGSLRFVVYRYP